MHLQVLEEQPLRLAAFRPDADQLLDACSYSLTHTVVLSTTSIYLVQHTLKHPVCVKTIPLASLSFPETVLFASVLQCFELGSGRARCMEVLACSADNAACFVVTLGDGAEGDPLTVLLKQPIEADAVRREVRVSDTLKVVLREASLYLKDGSELLLMSVDGCSSVTRRHLQLVRVRDTTALLLAVHNRVFRFTTCARLQFALEYHDSVVCISGLGDGRMAVVLADGTVHIVSVDTGCTVLSRKHPVLPHERVKAVTGSANGVFWVSDRRLVQVIILRAESLPCSFTAPFLDRVYVGAGSASGSGLVSVQMPKEYDAMPWRMSCSTADQRHFSIAGRFGFCVHHQGRNKWTILHPDAQPLVLVDAMQFIDADLLLVSCTVFDKTRGTRTWELRVYSTGVTPITIVFRTVLGAQCRLMTVSRDKSICVVDVTGKLCLYKCTLNAGWAVEASADLQAVTGIRRVLYSSHQFFILKDSCVYTVKLSSILSGSNPVACTVASIWEGERVEDMWQLEHDIVALLAFREQSWRVILRRSEHVLCQVPVEPPIHSVSLRAVNDAVLVLPQLLLYSLRHGMRDLAESVLPDVFTMLEPCLFEAWNGGLVQELLAVLPSDDSRVLLSIARVARTLEYHKAVQFVAAYGHSIGSLFWLFLALRSCEGVLLLFKLCLEDDSVDWLGPTIKLLLDCYQLDSVQEVLGLAHKLALPCSAARQLVEGRASKAFGQGNLFDLKQYEAILGSLHLDPGVPDSEARRDRLVASMVIDPGVVEWAEGNPQLQAEVRILHALDQ